VQFPPLRVKILTIKYNATIGIGID
jgi:hypothetical protein